jgi:hypothetical protein
LTKLIGVSWITAHRMLRKLRVAMGDQNRLYRLEGIIELDDAFVGGKRPGKRGRGAEGKTAILVACEHNNGWPGFVALKAVGQVTQDTVKAFAQEAIEHPFDAVCQQLGIGHRTTQFRHPWTNGQVEITNKTIKQATTKQFHYTNASELKTHLMTFLLYYNHQRPLKALSFKNPLASH